MHASYYGVFLAAGAVGNVPGALLADRIVTKIGSAATLISAAAVSGVAYVVMALAHSWVLAGPAFVVVGFSVAAGSVVAISLRQQLTPNDLMGRVGSAWRGIVWGAAPVGALLAGGLAVLGGLRLPILLAGGAQCVVAVLLARPLLRRLGGAGNGAFGGGPRPSFDAGSFGGDALDSDALDSGALDSGGGGSGTASGGAEAGSHWPQA